MDSGAKLLRRVTAEKERLSHAVRDLQEALEQEVRRKRVRDVHAQMRRPCPPLFVPERRP